MSHSLYLLHIKKVKKVEQYPIDYTTDIFKKYVKKLKHAQHLFVEKKGINVYYTYLRRLNASNTDYYGFCFAFTGEYIENIDSMFECCETLLYKILKQNELLSGSMPLNLQIENAFHKKSPELKRIENWFKEIASHYNLVKPFVGALADTSEIEIPLENKSKDEKLFAIRNYNHINCYSNKLTNGVANVVGVEREKNYLPIIIWLLFIGGFAIFFIIKCNDENKRLHDERVKIELDKSKERVKVKQDSIIESQKEKNTTKKKKTKRENPYLNLSTTEISVSHEGGTKRINITCDSIWKIGTGTYSWIKLSKSNDGVTLKIERNETNKSREDYFTIKSGKLTKRVNIKQSANKKRENPYLNLSTTEISVSHEGGRKRINITCDSIWKIGTGTYSWIKLSKSSDGVTLKIERNETNSSREDYFTIKSGKLTKRVNIKQSANDKPNAKIDSLWVEHNIPKNGKNYMRIHVNFVVNNKLNEKIWVCAFFYDEDGNRLTSSINGYKTPDGQLTVQDTGSPRYKSSQWEDFVLEIPYSVIKKGSNKFYIKIIDSDDNNLATSKYIHFTVY